MVHTRAMNQRLQALRFMTLVTSGNMRMQSAQWLFVSLTVSWFIFARKLHKNAADASF
jgi:hypothetical protein